MHNNSDSNELAEDREAFDGISPYESTARTFFELGSAK